MEKKAFPFLVHVIPLLPLSSSCDTFSYASPSCLLKGTFVKIPFGKREVLGIVQECQPLSHNTRSSPFSLKPLSYIFPLPLSPQQWEFTARLSQHSLAPRGVILRSFFLSPSQARRKDRIPTVSSRASSLKAHFSPAQKKALHEFQRKSTHASSSSFLLTGPAGSGKTEVLLHLARFLKREKKQMLLLVPEILFLHHLLLQAKKRLPSSHIATLHSKQIPSQQWEAWQRISRGEVSLIIGTRKALFAPFKNLACVAIEEEHDPSHSSWDAAPFYDTRRAAFSLANTWKSLLILSSATPSTEALWWTQKKFLTEITLPPRSSPPSLEIIDMRKQQWKQGKSASFQPMLSDSLLSHIQETLTKKHSFLLLVPRRGEGKFSLCQECKEVFRCPSCDRALISVEEQRWKCLHCSYKTPLFPSCPSCGSLRFLTHGTGTLRIQRTLRRLFPSFPLIRIDAESTKKAHDASRVVAQIHKGPPSIIIGTPMAIKGLDLPSLGGVGIIDTDALWSFPDFRADEHTAQLILQLAGRLAHSSQKKSPGKLSLQTFQPQRPVLEMIVQGHYQEWCHEEVQQRVRFGYPPKHRLIVIEGQEKTQEKLQQQLHTVEPLFTAILQAAHGRFLGSFVPLRPKRRGKFFHLLAGSIPSDHPDEPLPPALQEQLIRHLPSHWNTKVDPPFLLS